MKKLLCLVLGVSILASLLVVTGCGGGGGGLVGALVAGALIISLAASGPAGAAAFAASVRTPIRAAIYQDTVSSKYVVRITPTGKTPVATSTITISTDGKTLSFKNLSIELSTDGQYLVEFFPANYTANTSPFFKYYFKKTSGETYNGNISVADTAQALAYDEWKKKAPTKSFSDFTAQNPDVSTLTTTITAQMNLIGTFSGDLATFTWDAAVASEAVSVASATSVPTTTTTSSSIITGSKTFISMSTSTDFQTDLHQNSGTYLSLMHDSNVMAYGLGSNDYSTRMVCYRSGVNSLNSISTATTYDNSGNLHRHWTYPAKGSTPLAVGDVFEVYFTHNQTYGAFQITGINGSEISVSFKLNKTAGDKNLDTTTVTKIATK